MAAAAMKHMASNFDKLDKFEGVDFMRWQKKMHFLLSSMSVIYVLTTPIPEDGENATMEQIKRMNKWENDDYDSDKPKGNNVAGPSVFNMVEHNNSIMYNFNKGKRKYQDTKADPNKKSKVTCWKCGKPRHLKKDCKGGKIGNKSNGSVNGSSNSLKDRCWFKTYESLNDGSILHMGNESTALDEALDKFKVFKTEVELQQGSLIKIFRTDRGGEYMDTLYFQSVGIIHETTAPYTPQQNGISERKNRGVKLPDLKLKTLGERDIECIFVGYAEHFKTFRFYVIEPNESVSINLINESRDAIFDENRFSSVPRPSQRSLINIGGSMVPEEATEEVMAQQPKPELRKSKRNKTPKNFRHEFQLYLIEGIRDEVSDQQSYCFNVENDPKTFDEAMQSQDVAFWKEAINDKMDYIMGNNTCVLADLPPAGKPLGCKWIFKQKTEGGWNY
ncbi:zinc finger, CCHC-type containing protein [Tanacetum coccineum]